MRKEPFTHDAYKGAYSKDEELREVFNSCIVRFMCMMVKKMLTTISRIGYSIGWTSYVFLKVSDCS